MDPARESGCTSIGSTLERSHRADDRASDSTVERHPQSSCPRCVDLFFGFVIVVSYRFLPLVRRSVTDRETMSQCRGRKNSQTRDTRLKITNAQRFSGSTESVQFTQPTVTSINDQFVTSITDSSAQCLFFIDNSSVQRTLSRSADTRFNYPPDNLPPRLPLDVTGSL